MKMKKKTKRSKNNNNIAKMKKYLKSSFLSIYKNKFLLIIFLTSSLFIFKNIYYLAIYSNEINNLKTQYNKETSINKTLKENIKYYKSDEFIIRYSIEHLTLRPTQKHKLIHIPVLPPSKVENNGKTTEETTSTTSNDSANE